MADAPDTTTAPPAPPPPPKDEAQTSGDQWLSPQPKPRTRVPVPEPTPADAPVDFRQLQKDARAFERARFEREGAEQRERSNAPAKQLVQVFDGVENVMAPVDPAEQRIFLEERAAARAKVRESKRKEAEEVAAYFALSPIERAKIPAALRAAYEATAKKRPF